MAYKKAAPLTADLLAHKGDAAALGIEDEFLDIPDVGPAATHADPVEHLADVATPAVSPWKGLRLEEISEPPPGVSPSSPLRWLVPLSLVTAGFLGYAAFALYESSVGVDVFGTVGPQSPSPAPQAAIPAPDVQPAAAAKPVPGTIVALPSAPVDKIAAPFVVSFPPPTEKMLQPLLTALPGRDAAPAGRVKRVYRVQLYALASEAAVRREWSELQKAHEDLLGDLDLTVVRTASATKSGDLYRMQVGALDGARPARKLCNLIRQRKLDCIVVRP